MPVRLDEQMDFVDRLQAVGFEASVEVLEAIIAPIGELDGSTRLDVDAPTRALRTTKRWRADGVVAVVATDTVPLGRGCDEAAVLAAVDEPVIELAAMFGTCRADWMCTWPSAVELTADTAALLEYDVGRASLRTEQLGIGRLGTTAFYAVEHHRPDLVDYGMIRTIYS
jgi:DNA-binding GntR family transcriptional regulator